ncbi:hypothetical protein D3C78_809970 [compost metagenome]
MAEQLRFQQMGGNRRTVDLDERAVAARAVVMQRAGDQLLAGAGFAIDQHDRQVHVGHVAFRLQHLAHHGLQRHDRRRLADQRIQPGPPGIAAAIERQAVLQLLGFEGLVDQQLEFGQHHRLGQVIERAGLHRLHGALHVAVGGHHHHLDLGVLAAHLTDQLHTAQARQGIVGEQHVGMLAGECRQGLLSRPADQRFVALALEVGTDIVGQDFIVLDDHHAVLHLFSLPRQS